jgi:hypothetical protein
MLQYMSIGLGQSREKTRIQMLERMIQPVGKPPEVSGHYDAVSGYFGDCMLTLGRRITENDRQG